MTNEELNARIRELCEERGMRFAPWECHPANAREGPWRQDGTVFAESLPKAWALRQRLIAQISGSADVRLAQLKASR
jgi:hypothetical protein